MNIDFLNMNLVLQTGRVLGIVLGSYILYKITKRFLPQFLGKSFEFAKKTGLTSEQKRSKKRGETILGVATGIIKALIFSVSGMMVLSEVGIDITPIIASAGIIGLAVGFGAQTLVKDFINGIFILLEDQFSEDDLIKVGSSEGKVERMSLRSTTLRDLDGIVHIIPNSKITNVANLSRDFAQVNLDLELPINIKVDTAKKMLKDISEQLVSTKKMAELVLNKPILLGMESIDIKKFVMKVVIRTKPLKQFEVARQFRYLFKKALEELEESSKNSSK